MDVFKFLNIQQRVNVRMSNSYNTRLTEKNKYRPCRGGATSNRRLHSIINKAVNHFTP